MRKWFKCFADQFVSSDFKTNHRAKKTIRKFYLPQLGILETRINPVSAVGDSYNAILGESTRLDVLTNDTPTGGTQIFSTTAVSPASGTTLQQNTDGTFTFQANSTGLYTFNYTATGTQQKLLHSAGLSGDEFGHNMAIENNFLVVGSVLDDVGSNIDQGSVTVFTKSGNNWVQQAFLTAPDGLAGDLFGYDVAISGYTLVVTAWNDDVGSNTDQGSAYVYVFDGTNWNYQAKLIASDGSANDIFGRSIAIDGDYIIVGSTLDDVGAQSNRGSGYVYLRTGTTWAEQARLFGSGATGTSEIGTSVGISGNTIVMGAYADIVSAKSRQGSAFVYTRTGTTWSQQAQLTASDGLAEDWFGVSVDISSDTIAVGAPRDDINPNTDQGSVYIFNRSGSVWTQAQKIVASDAGANDWFGYDVSISGNNLGVGSQTDTIGSNANQGSGYVFTYSNSSWTQYAKVIESDGAAGDYFGKSVALDGFNFAVGAYQKTIDGKTTQGAAYIQDVSLSTALVTVNVLNPIVTTNNTFYTTPNTSTILDVLANDTPLGGTQIFSATSVSPASGTNLQQNADGTFTFQANSTGPYSFNYTATGTQQKLLQSSGLSGDQFGHNMAIENNFLVVGSVLDDVGSNVDQGSVTVFTKSGNNWVQQAFLTAPDGLAGDAFGYDVAISGYTLVVTAWTDDVGSNTDQGSAYVYVFDGTTWNYQAKLIASDGSANDIFGRSIAIDGDYIIVGSTLDDVGAQSNRGSGYVYLRTGTTWAEQARLFGSGATGTSEIGTSVGISGNTIVMGAYADIVSAKSRQGSAFVYTRTGTTWSQQAQLTASDGLAEDCFGVSVDISSDTIAVGAPRDDINPNTDQGAVYIFNRSGSVWTQAQKLVASDAGANDWFGYDVSISGNNLGVGSQTDTIGSNANQGSGYVFTYSNSSWTQYAKVIESDGAAEDYFGRSVALDGFNFAVGAYQKTIDGKTTQGAAYIQNVFQSTASATVQVVNPPTVTLQSITTPTSNTISTLNVNFSEPVTGFDISDISLTFNGNSQSLASASITGTGSNYQIQGLSAITSQNGSYIVTISGSTSGIQSINGIALQIGTNTAWTMDSDIPIANIGAVVSPRNTAVVSMVVTFSEAVTGLDLNDFLLIRNSVNFISLAGASITGSGANYQINGLGVLTSTPGNYILILAANNSGILDLAGNSLIASATSNWVMNTTSPTLFITADKSTLKAGETASITCTLSESSSNFAVGDISVVGGVLSNFSGSGITYTATFTPTANSTTTATFDVAGSAFTDTAGNNNSPAAQFTIAVDTVTPTITIASSTVALKSGETATLTFTLSESSSNFAIGDISVVGGVLSNFSGSGITYTATFTPTVNSITTATFNIATGAFTHTAGNNNSPAAQLSVSVDTVAPAILIASDKTALKAGETATLTFTLSESSANFAVGDISVFGGALSNFSASGITYTATFTPTANSTTTATFNIATGAFTDTAGNNNSPATQFTIAVDTLAPTITIASSAVALKAGETASLTFTLSESSANFAVGDISVFGGVLSNFSGSGITYTATFTPTVNSTTTATFDIATGAFTDTAGNNNSPAAQLSVSVDTVAPTILIASDKTALKAGETATLTFTLSESSANFAVGDISVFGGALSNFSGSGITYTATFTPTANSTTTATFNIATGAFTDTAGNNNSPATQFTIAVDTVAPTAYFSPVTTPTFTSINIIQINFSEPIIGFNISDLTITCNGTNVNLNGISLSALNPYAFTINNLAAANSNDGTYVLTLNTPGAGIVDNAGNSLVTNSNLTWTYTSPVNPSTPQQPLTPTGDITPPSVTMGSVPSIGRSGLPQLTITFSENVTGLDIVDILLTRSGTVVDIQGAVLTGSGASYVLQNLENLTYPIGEYHLQIKAIGNGITDIAGNSLINPSAAEWYMAGADNALISLRSPKIDGSLEVRDSNTNKSWGIFTPFPGYFGAVHMVKGNFLGDGKEWIVMAAGEGGAPHIVVMDPVTGHVIRSWFGYSTDYRGGVFIAVGDVNGDGADDLITGPSAGGGPHIKVYDGKTNNVIFEFMAYDPSFLGGVSVALADVNYDGRLDIVTGAGKGGGPQVSAFDALNGRELLTFMAYDSTFRGGIFVAAGDSDGNGIWEIITGSGYGGSPNVKTFDIRTLQSIRNFMAYDPAFLGGVRVGLSDRNGDGILDLFTGPGLEGGPHIKVFDGVNLNLIDSFFAGVANDPYGVYVN